VRPFFDLVDGLNFHLRALRTVVRFPIGLRRLEVSAAARFSGIESRRSTRIDRTVPLVVVGQTKLGLSFQERTSAVSLNLHGCRYPSRHDYAVGSWIGLQVLEPNGESSTPVMRAQVRSIHPPMSPRELYQIGVELESPANVWGVPAPPEDWQKALGANGSRMQEPTGAAPAREPEATTSAPSKSTPAEPEYRSTGVTAFPSQPPAAAAKPERVVITSDQLVAAVHGKLQTAAEKAVHTAINDHLMGAVRQALSKIDDVCKASVHQIEEHSEQRLDTMMRTAREEVLSRMEVRLAEDRTRWEEHQEEFRGRTEELAERLEHLAAETQRCLTEAQRMLEKTSKEVEPRIREQLSQSVARVTEDFEAAATRVSDRQLVRLMEDKLMVTREAAAQMDASSAGARAQLQSSASTTMEEFKRQSEVQVDLIISEATQRVMSSLTALEAENRAACETRRRAIESDVARATEQSTEQFRTGMKAFLYSCLVAAVGAVDEHAKSTLDGLKDPGKVIREIGNASNTGNGTAEGAMAAASDVDAGPHSS
jgi:hypothetical protein